MIRPISFSFLFLFLIGCFGSPRYKVGECANCKFEDNPPASLGRLFYKVVSIDERAKTYSVVAVSDKDDENSKAAVEAVNSDKDMRVMSFDELDHPKPQGRTPTCTMTRASCPNL